MCLKRHVPRKAGALHPLFAASAFPFQRSRALCAQSCSVRGRPQPGPTRTATAAVQSSCAAACPRSPAAGREVLPSPSAAERCQDSGRREMPTPALPQRSRSWSGSAGRIWGMMLIQASLGLCAAMVFLLPGSLLLI